MLKSESKPKSKVTVEESETISVDSSVTRQDFIEVNDSLSKRANKLSIENYQLKTSVVTITNERNRATVRVIELEDRYKFEF